MTGVCGCERGGKKGGGKKLGNSGECQAVSVWAEVVLFEDVTVNTGTHGGRGGGGGMGGGGGWI